VSLQAPATGPITPDLEGLRRLERRLKRSLSIRAAWGRVWESLPAIIQITVAAVGAYSIAHFALGHPMPIVAVTVTITSLGFNRDARPVRVLRSILAILLGVLLASGILILFGSGVWQLVVVLLVVLVVARMLAKDLVFPVAAATPAALTVLLGSTYGGPYLRVLDAALAAVVALAVTALIPRAPGRDAARDARAASSTLLQAVGSIVDALRLGSPAAGELATQRVGKAPALIAAWTQSLDTARAVGRISPFLRRRLPEFDRSAALRTAVAASQHHLALITRRVEFMVRDGARFEGLADVVAEVERGMSLLLAPPADPAGAVAAREVLAALAARLHPDTAVAGGSAADAAVIVQLRPLVVDLLVATGLDLEAARDLLVRL